MIKMPLKKTRSWRLKIEKCLFMKASHGRMDGKPRGTVRKHCLYLRRREGSACRSGGDGSRQAAFVLLDLTCFSRELCSSLLQQPPLCCPGLKARGEVMQEALLCAIILFPTSRALLSFCSTCESSFLFPEDGSSKNDVLFWVIESSL